MEEYYSKQVAMPYFRGAARQRGRGLLTASAALGAVRAIYPIAKPLFKKYILPAAKRLGTSFIHNLVPEVVDAAKGKQKLTKGVKRAAKKTVRAQLGGGKRKKVIRKGKSKRNSRSKDIFKSVEF
jgi:hypothetical protein